MQVLLVRSNLDPARCLFDVVTRVVRTPALDEAQTQDAEFAEVVDADARSHSHPSFNQKPMLQQKQY